MTNEQLYESLDHGGLEADLALSILLKRKKTKRQEFEHEFLIKLAATWLECRWCVMGHQIEGSLVPNDVCYNLLGCHDYEYEMKLLCEEVKASASCLNVPSQP